jgi:sensor histidine kinase YesM
MGDEPIFLDFCVKYAIAGIVFYYTALFIFKVTLEGKRYLLLALLLAFSILLNFGLRYSSYFVLLPGNFGFTFPKMKWQDYFIMSLWWWFQYSVFALGYWYFQRSTETERKLRITETENLNLQNQELKLQYNYLQAQINPHFLYNTLNFLYTEAQESNEKLADAIIALSHIMRYSIAEGKEKDTIAVEQEVEVLDKYILLHQLRFDNQLNIQFTKEMENPGRQIPPYILITLMENAFKHGQFSKAEEMLYIHLHCTDSSLVFYTENTINPLPKNQSGSGVGLTNIAERLRLTYGNRQRLQYYKEGNRFIVRLEIDFASQKITATAV